MKSAALLGLGPLSAETVPLERQRARDRAVDETYFRVELAAGVCNYFGAVTEVDANNAVVMRFPNAASTYARRIVRGRDLWPRTRLRFDVWYTSPVGSTANFELLGVMWCHDAGGTVAGAGIAVTWTAAGPAVAGTPMKTSAVVTAPVNSTPHEVVRLAIGRNDPDANVNALDIFLCVATLEEVA